MAAAVTDGKTDNATTVPLYMKHDDRKILIGTADIDAINLVKKGQFKKDVGDLPLTEVIATNFTFGPA